uniref:Uncharacterized protein n=1 Tax=Acrobeloides nanus TaxID=290746 RepID=A0A914CQC2_9BILA
MVYIERRGQQAKDGQGRRNQRKNCPKNRERRHEIEVVQKAWGILEAAIYGRKFRTIEELKAALQEAWERIDLNVLASSVDNWRKRLRACVQANGGYFEI